MAGIAVTAGLFVVWLVVLLAASDRFTSATERLGLSLGISPFIIGATVVAGGTSLPELVSSVLAVVRGEPDIVVGNVVGSNVANVFLVLGTAAVVARRLRVDRELERVDLPLFTTSAAFLLVAAWDGTFAWYEGVLALAGLGVYVHFTLSEEQRLDEVVEELVESHVDLDYPEEVGPGGEGVAAETSVGIGTYVVLLGSLAFVFLSADRLVAAILELATALEVNTGLVALTAVGIGTSLPEIAVSVTAVRRGDAEIAVGNVLGSNVFNAFAVMGIPSFLAPLTVPPTIRTYALPVMVLAAVLYFFITQDREITRWEGVTLLLVYGIFLVNLASFV